jgi:hypothetical protein
MALTLKVLEWLGLAVAGLDFLDWTPKIQAWIDRNRYRCFIWLDDKGNERFAKSNWVVGITSLASCALFVWWWYAWLSDAPNAQQVFLWWLLVATGLFIILFVLIPAFFNIMLIINRVPSKTVGAFAFFLAVITSLLGYLWHASHRCLEGGITG